jgi:hypothetical protein
MNLPDTLPARLYLLAYDTDKNRLTSKTQLGLVVRAAALADLYLDRRLTDDGGQARVVDTGPTGDPVLDEILADLAAVGPRSWNRLIGRHEGRAARPVRDQLETAGWLKVERHAIMPDKVELREGHKVKKYAGDVKMALQRPAAGAEPRTAAALALAAYGELGTVLSRGERREHKKRLIEFADRTGPVADALKKALHSKRAVMAST